MMGQNENAQYQEALDAHQAALKAHLKAEEDLIKLQQQHHAINSQQHQQHFYNDPLLYPSGGVNPSNDHQSNAETQNVTRPSSNHHINLPHQVLLQIGM
jgi:uncharacterized glyoxalase superfamily metalloenzyme YdcJ